LVSDEAENPQAPLYRTRTPTPLSREAEAFFQVAIPHGEIIGFFDGVPARIDIRRSTCYLKKEWLSKPLHDWPGISCKISEVKHR
jgi:hypothetical protein